MQSMHTSSPRGGKSLVLHPVLGADGVAYTRPVLGGNEERGRERNRERNRERKREEERGRERKREEERKEKKERKQREAINDAKAI